MAVPVTEQIAFDRQRDAIDFEYQTNIARNAADQSQLNLDERIGLGNLRRTLRRGRQALPGQFVNRGLLNSGIYRGAISEYGREQTEQYSQFRNQFARNRTALYGQLSAFDANRAIRLADVGLNQATRRSAIASVLQGVG